MNFIGRSNPFNFASNFTCNTSKITIALRWLIASSLYCAVAGSAGAVEREVELRFLPQASPITGYLVYLTNAATGVEDVIDVGFVLPGFDGIARTYVVVDAAESYLVGMKVYGAAGESQLSNVIEIGALQCDPGPCDDGNACTADSCGDFGCSNVKLPDDTPCDDGFVDTLDDRCVAGVCEGVVFVCGSDLDCDDGNACNGFETCEDGRVCLEGTAPDCGDSTQCAVPQCDPESGCQMAPIPDGTLCDDGLIDTLEDGCAAGVCSGAPRVCSLDRDCDDANACNGFESCDGGLRCLPGTAPDCGEPTECAVPHCDPTFGCEMTPVPDGIACDDGSPDTCDDQCNAGACEGQLMVCRSDLDCDDGNICNGVESCQDGLACLEGTALDCGGASQCAVPLCDPVSGCGMASLPDGTPCDDGVVDTLGDSCRAGVCEGSVPLEADPDFWIHDVSSRAAFGGHILRIYGGGFESGARVELVSDSGRRRRVRYLYRVDSSALVAWLRISRRTLRRASSWQVVVTLPDGHEAVMSVAL